MNGRRGEFERWFAENIWHGMWGYAPDVPLDVKVLETYWRCYDAGARAELPALVADIEQHLKHNYSGRYGDRGIAWGSQP